MTISAYEPARLIILFRRDEHIQFAAFRPRHRACVDPDRAGGAEESEARAARAEADLSHAHATA